MTKPDETLITIRKIRKSRGYSQSYMAERLHVVEKTYQNMERGNTKIDLPRLREIAIILAVSINDLIDERQEKETHNDTERPKGNLYERIIQEKEQRIAHLEDELHFYRVLLQEGRVLS